MKKSEILKHLNKVNSENVKSYYVHGTDITKILVVHVNELNWECIRIIGKYILNVTANEKSEYDNTIRVALECEIE